MGSSSSKDKGEDGGEVVKSSGFHLIELHLPTAGVGFVSIVFIIVVAWLLSKFKTKLVKRYRDRPRIQETLGYAAGTPGHVSSNIGFTPTSIPLVPIRPSTSALPQIHVSPFTPEDYQKINKIRQFVPNVNRLDCKDITEEDELRLSPTPARRRLSGGPTSRSGKRNCDSP